MSTDGDIPVGAGVSVAPASLTGGGGFSYENLVGAWAAAALLRGALPLGTEIGAFDEVRFQTVALGEALDDLLLTGGGGRRWSASIKSYDMLTGGKLEEEFVAAAWAALLESDFDPGRDRLGLVCAAAAESNWKALGKLISASRADQAKLAARIKVPRAFNAKDRSLWDSCRCPQDLAEQHGIERDASPARLLASLLPLRLDLGAPGSQAGAKAMGWCRQALIPAQAARAEALWAELVTLIGELRPEGGAIDWPLLLERLGDAFQFRLRPDAEPDWALLQRWSEEALKSVRDELGEGIVLPRDAAWASLEAATAAIVALAGPSGCGKTALAKRWLGDGAPLGLWLSAAELEDGLAALAERLGLHRPLIEVLALAPGPVRIVIDGLDRSYGQANFAAAAAIGRLAAESRGRIRLLFTSQQMELGRVSEQLAAANGSRFELVEITNLDSNDVALVLAAAPSLAKIADAGQLHSALKRPKLLDLVLRATQASSPDLAQVTDETAVADLWWRRLAVVGREAAVRQELLLKLAAEQADELRAFTPAGELAPADVAAAGDLRRDGILEEGQARYAFAHDLFADWALLQRLRAVGEDAAVRELVTKAALPSWHRAIRLYALSVLRDGGLPAWSGAHRLLIEADEPLLADLFLDAPLFAQDADEQLRALWPVLIEDDGALLRRLLQRFLYVATIPDPTGALLFAGEPELEAHWASQTRVPLAPLWPAVLELIDAYREVAISLASQEVAAIVDLWLRKSCPGDAHCIKAAEIAIAIGRFVLSENQAGKSFGQDPEISLWKSVVAAGAVDPAGLLELLVPALEPAEEEDR